jgi:NAD(P)-dependent dehydrogenase (short-subunit alcohol dehydrogenase family)
MRLENKIAVISGVGTGQGRAAAILFAKEGAKIVGCDWKREDGDETTRLVKAAGGEMVFVKADVSGSADCENVIRTAIKISAASTSSITTPASDSRRRSRWATS